MLKTVFKLMIIFLIISGPVSAQDLKIFTYNIHGGSTIDPDPLPPTGKDVQIRNIAAVINKASPDIAMMQEVDNFTTWAGNMNQSDSLINLTGMNGYFGMSRYTAGTNGEAGILMLSRYPIIDKMVYQLPSVDIAKGIPRIMVIISVKIRGQKLYFAGAHLDLDSLNRHLQAQAIVKIINALPYPVTLAGDLNDFPNSTTLNILQGAMTLGNTSAPFSFRSDNPNKTPDHMLFNAKMLQSYNITSYESINTSASDHLPLLVRLSSDKSTDIMSWRLAAPNKTGNEVSDKATNVAAGLDTSILVRGAGLNNTPTLSRAFAAGANFASSAVLADTAIAIDKNMYFAFNVSPKTGSKVSLSNIFYRARISAGGANTWYWTYSTDNIHFNRITVANRLTAATPTEGADQTLVALSNIAALQNILPGTTIYFRVYVAGTSLPTGSTAFGRSSNDTSHLYALSVRGKVESSAYKPIVAWQFGNPESAGNEATQAAGTVAEGLTVPILKRSGGLRQINSLGDSIKLQRSFVTGVSVATSASSAADTAAAVANNLYYSFEVSPLYGHQLSLSLMRARIRSSASGARTWYWKYSLDGTIFNKLAAPYYNASTANGVQMPDIDLTANKALQLVAPGHTIYFRLYMQGANATTSTSAIGRSATGTNDDYVLDLGGKVEKYYDSPIIGWQFSDPQSTGSENTISSTLTSSGLETAKLKRGPGFRTTTAGGSTISLARAFVGGATTTSIATSKADTATAVANNLYYSFEVKPTTDHKVSLSTLNARVRSDINGAKVWYWKYSLDSLHFNKLAEPYFNSNTTAEGVQAQEINISSIAALQNITAGQKVYFRLYMQGSDNDAGVSGIGRSVNSGDYVLALGGSVVKLISSTPIVAWQFGTPASAGGEIEQPSTLTAPGFIPSIIRRSGNLINIVSLSDSTRLTLARGYVSGALVASTATSAADTATAVINNLFLSFEIKPAPGSKASLSTLNARVRASLDGAKTYSWKYSLVNNFDKKKFIKLAEPYYNANTTAGVQLPEVDLSAIPALQNIGFGQAVYFRLYVQGSNATTGTTALGISGAGTDSDYVLKVTGNIEATLPLPVYPDSGGVSMMMMRSSTPQSLAAQSEAPVNLRSFNGKADRSAINLNWQTPAQTTTSEFEVLRIQSGRSPESVGRINGQASTGQQQSYSLSDYRFQPGPNYYQLKQISQNGDQHLSEVIKVDAEVKKTDMVIAAETGKITVFISAVQAEKGNLYLFNAYGKMQSKIPVALVPGQNTYHFDGIRFYGVYVVGLEVPSGAIRKKTIIN